MLRSYQVSQQTNSGRVAYETSLGCLYPKSASFGICMHARKSPHLPRFQVQPSKSRLRASIVRSQSIQKENKRTLRTQIKCDVENFKPWRNPVSYRKPRFCKRRVWTQVKVKNSRELKRYISQNISSNSLNSTVNKVGVLAKFVFSQTWLYLIDKLLKLLRVF